MAITAKNFTNASDLQKYLDTLPSDVRVISISSGLPEGTFIGNVQLVQTGQASNAKGKFMTFSIHFLVDGEVKPRKLGMIDVNIALTFAEQVGNKVTILVEHSKDDKGNTREKFTLQAATKSEQSAPVVNTESLREKVERLVIEKNGKATAKLVLKSLDKDATDEQIREFAEDAGVTI